MHDECNKWIAFMHCTTAPPFSAPYTILFPVHCGAYSTIKTKHSLALWSRCLVVGAIFCNVCNSSWQFCLIIWLMLSRLLHYYIPSLWEFPFSLSFFFLSLSLFRSRYLFPSFVFPPLSSRSLSSSLPPPSLSLAISLLLSFSLFL